MCVFFFGLEYQDLKIYNTLSWHSFAKQETLNQACSVCRMSACVYRKQCHSNNTFASNRRVAQRRWADCSTAEASARTVLMAESTWGGGIRSNLEPADLRPNLGPPSPHWPPPDEGFLQRVDNMRGGLGCQGCSGQQLGATGG